MKIFLSISYMKNFKLVNTMSKFQTLRLMFKNFLYSLYFFQIERTLLYRPSQGQKYFLKVVKNASNFYRV